MMPSFVPALVALVLLASPALSLQKKLSPDVEAVALRYMDNKDTMDLVELSAPKDDMIEALDAIAAEIRGEQIDAENQHNSLLEAHNQTISNANTELDAKRVELSEAQSRAATLQAQIDAAEAAIVGLEQDVAAKHAEINQTAAEEQREREARAARQAERQQIIERHNNALDRLNELIEMVQNFDFEHSNETLARLQSSIAESHQQSRPLSMRLKRAAVLISRAAANGSGDRNEIKQRLLDMLADIVSGVEHSLQLYQNDEANDVATFDALMADFANLQQQFANDLVNLNAAIQQQQADIARDEALLMQENANIQGLEAEIASLEQLISDTEQAIVEAQNAFDMETSQRVREADSVEAARAYILENIEGMSAADDCHPGSPNCARCLYDGHCSATGQVCSREGYCEDAQPAFFSEGFLAVDQELRPAPGHIVGQSIPDAAQASGEYTYLFFFRTHSLATEWQNIFNVQPPSTGNSYPRLPGIWLHRSRVLHWSVSTSTNNNYHHNSHNLANVDEWMFVAFTVSDTSKATVLYTQNMNSGSFQVQPETFTGDLHLDANAAIYLCERFQHPQLDGEVKKFSFYPRVLSEAEIREYMEFYA